MVTWKGKAIVVVYLVFALVAPVAFAYRMGQLSQRERIEQVRQEAAEDAMEIEWEAWESFKEHYGIVYGEGEDFERIVVDCDADLVLCDDEGAY